MNNPGILQVRRYFDKKGNLADMIYDVHTALKTPSCIIDPLDVSRVHGI